MLLALALGALAAAGCSAGQPTPAAPGEATAPAEAAGPDLAGAIYFVGTDDGRQKVFRLDPATGALATISDPPADALVMNVTASPDGRQLALAYAPPPVGSQIQFGFAGLYVMAADGSGEPTSVLERADPSETIFNLSWPLADYLYYAHYGPTFTDLGEVLYRFQIQRLRYPEGTVEVVAADAAWPRLSADGAELAYVSQRNETFVAAADGADPRLILPPDAYPAVDAPFFSPDGRSLYFSAVAEGTPLSWWDRLTGVRVASAHDVPSDWYRQPAAGGEPERLTRLDAIGLYGDFAPDGRHIAFISTTGLYVMNPDGSGVAQLADIPGTGTLDWVP